VLNESDEAPYKVLDKRPCSEVTDLALGQQAAVNTDLTPLAPTSHVFRRGGRGNLPAPPSIIIYPND